MKSTKTQVKEASGTTCFWCNDGKILKSIHDLADAFEKMKDEVFLYHVTKEKNDFSKWVGDILGDKKLAQSLKQAKTKSQASTKVRARIKELFG